MLLILKCAAVDKGGGCVSRSLFFDFDELGLLSKS